MSVQQPTTRSTTRGLPQSPLAALCPWCGYDLAGIIEGARCPECGSGFGPQEAAAVAARQRLVQRAPRICTRCMLAPLAIGAVLMLFVLMLGGPVGNAVMVLSVGAALPVVALVAGLPVVVLSRSWERAAVFLSWIRHAWWLMLAWLALPVLAMLVGCAWLVVGLPRASATAGSDAVLLSLIMVAPPWATLTLMGLLAWVGAWHESEKDVKHHPRLRAVGVCLGVAAMLLTSVAAALWAGAIVAAPIVTR